MGPRRPPESESCFWEVLSTSSVSEFPARTEGLGLQASERDGPALSQAPRRLAVWSL